MNIYIRKFQKDDIPFKVKWINDEKNNRYLHYDLPLREDKTLEWFRTLQFRPDRVDYTIICDGDPVGIIGLINIDKKKLEAEYYICVGEEKFKGKGIAKKSTEILFKIASKDFGLKKIYLYTEIENISAQKTFEKIGFRKEKLLRNHIFYRGKYIDRYLYILDLEKYLLSVGV